MPARGATTSKLALAATIAEAKLRRLYAGLDELSDAGSGTVLGGAPLSRTDHLTLLANSPDYQARTLAALPFATAADRERLQRDLERVAALYPHRLPAGVAQPPRLGIPELDQGIEGIEPTPPPAGG